MKTGQNKDKEIDRFLNLMSEYNINIEKVKKSFLQQDKIEKEKKNNERFYFQRRLDSDDFLIED